MQIYADNNVKNGYYSRTAKIVKEVDYIDFR